MNRSSRAGAGQHLQSDGDDDGDGTEDDGDNSGDDDTENDEYNTDDDGDGTEDDGDNTEADDTENDYDMGDITSPGGRPCRPWPSCPPPRAGGVSGHCTCHRRLLHRTCS